MEIGIIGTGKTGKAYAKEFAKAGYAVNCCDLPAKREQLEKELYGTGINILDDGIVVSRRSDMIFYLVEMDNIEKAAAIYGPATKKNAIVSSGTSVMTPAVEAFEKYMPKDVKIINWHWLFGPSISPKGQTSAVVNHRSSEEDYKMAMDAFEKIGTKIVELDSYEEHDKITTDTQATPHLAFESMGTAWKNAGFYPWENPSYAGGIDNVKVLICLRIYSGEPHLYSGIAMHNPFAKSQIRQYAKSESELFKIMIQEDEKNFRERLKRARDYVFGNNDNPILLDDKIMGKFGLGISAENKISNSHSSLLAKVDAWRHLDINPYRHLICQTPNFRLLLGITEYLFRNEDLLEESIETALFDKKIRGDDLEFHTAVREWSKIIENGDSEGYKKQFEETKAFFADRLEEGMKKSDELIKMLSENAA